MMSVRTRLILTAALALLAALAPNCAHAGFSRPMVMFPAGGEGATFVWFAEASADETSPDGAGPVDPTTPLPPPEPDDPSEPPVFCPVSGMPTGGMGASGTASSPQSSSGPSTAAIPNETSELPQATLTARLPAENDPSFANPPPWTPLRPPRGNR